MMQHELTSTSLKNIATISLQKHTQNITKPHSRHCFK